MGYTNTEQEWWMLQSSWLDYFYSSIVTFSHAYYSLISIFSHTKLSSIFQVTAIPRKRLITASWQGQINMSRWISFHKVLPLPMILSMMYGSDMWGSDHLGFLSWRELKILLTFIDMCHMVAKSTKQKYNF